ncbi:lipid II flippase MurJ [Alienimonas chondri]|uniref:Murein biosynthesis integral membrane protein MurJ n=1 Tax=Alienimonas chondri TaxID=2681879 RepID=A0ABX1VFM0_9PLAN|nr:lipid II flippase MurJ [Alienimonas chondri]NNJ26801.1 hypothetical protein [Alienimonas chondri]
MKEPDRGRTRTTFAGAPAVAGLTLVSRLLGLFRDMATAAVFGAGPVLDAFTVAFRLPNLARRLLGEGALSAAVLPALVKTREERGQSVADTLAAAVVGRLAVGLSLATLAIEVVLIALALGWIGDLDDEWRLLWGLTAACGPLATFTCVGAQLAAALHARGRFVAAAACPVLLNLFWIAGAVGAAIAIGRGTAPERAIYQIAAAVSLGGAAQMALMLFALKRGGFVWRWDPAGTRPAIRAIRAAVAPALVGLSVAQVNSLIDGFASWGFAAPAGEPTAELLPGVLYPLSPGAGVAAAACLAVRALCGPAGLGWSAEAELLAAVTAAVAAFVPASRLLGMTEVWELVGVRRGRG